MIVQELRIGNWVKWVADEYADMPMQMDADNLKAFAKGRVFFQPIPLTPEILEKCGFEKMMRENDYIFNGFRITHVHLTGNFCYGLGNGNNPPAMKYLHQLQNLYYSLTGEELNVQL